MAYKISYLAIKTKFDIAEKIILELEGITSTTYVFLRRYSVNYLNIYIL